MIDYAYKRIVLLMYIIMVKILFISPLACLAAALAPLACLVAALGSLT